MIKTLKVSEIVTDAGTQVRAGLNDITVADYAEALADGAKFPPVIVFHDGNRYIAADGFHRIHAVIKNGAKVVECDVRKGGKTDALKFALGCNAHHGLRRTNADKRHAVGMALREFPNVSTVAIAKLCLVGDELVAEMRKAQPTDSGRLASPPMRVGLDGRERKLPPPPMVRRGAAGQVPPWESGDMSPHSTANGTDAMDGKRRLGRDAQVNPRDAGSTLPPPPSRVLDGTGWAIPTQLIPLWQRAGEVQEMLTTLSRVKSALRTAQANNDSLFAEVNYSSALSQLDQAWTDIKTAKPFAVCPTCQGQLPDKCTLCRGRGLISEHRWNTCVTREDKEFRFKAKGKRI